MSRSEWVSTLPPWRRLLAMLNWRPVYDIEQESEQLRIKSLESEKRIKQIENETEQIENEIDQLKQDNARLAVLNSKMDALLRRDESSYQLPPSTGSS
jgi:septal ring factor EnvC (AmiA/AmiB activator)